MRALAIFLAGMLGAACGSDATEVRLKLQASPPASLLLGDVGGVGDGSGRHYDLWAERSGGSLERVVRFVVIPTLQEDADLHGVPVGAPQLRDLDTAEFLGYPMITCGLGACGGARIHAALDLSDIVGARITREADDAPGARPSDDVVVAGSIDHYARGTLRGTLESPDGENLPQCEIVVIPAVDDASL